MIIRSSVENIRINESNFDKLLVWLDCDRDAAAAKYLDIRGKLIRRFTSRGCSAPEELTDQTIDRVAKKAEWLMKNYVGEPVRYFFGVARIVFLESTRKTKYTALTVNSPTSLQNTYSKEFQNVALSRCLRQLTDEESAFILKYYCGEKSDKIRNRKRMCEELRLSDQALRVRAYRIRTKLKRSIIAEMNALRLKDSGLDIIEAMAHSFRKKLSQIPNSMIIR